MELPPARPQAGAPDMTAPSLFIYAGFVAGLGLAMMTGIVLA
ncbi:hypothetical protein [Jannaschia formosa]|nr:hypothetical protein [Jannaschia formosa]